MKVIDSTFSSVLLTQIRNENTSSEILQKNLIDLGRILGQEILGDNATTYDTVTTPLGLNFEGLKFVDLCTVVISTKDDYSYFANGLSSVINNTLRGYMDFDGLRGPDALTNPVRAIDLPELKPGQIIDTVIVAKSVLATGCTAISLTRKAVEKYQPRKLIIASVFYSDMGIRDVWHFFPHANFYVFGKPDQVNDKGLLIPGVGNLDVRVNGSINHA